MVMESANLWGMATRKRTVQRRSSIDLMTAVKDYLLNRSMRERSAHFEDTLKKQLMTELEARGEWEGQTQKIKLDTPQEFTAYKSGTPSIKTIVGIERRERRSNTLDQERALALIKKKGLTDECTETIVVLNEDALLAANFRGDITDKELATLYTESTSYAFWLTEA
jgi:hypothetical protein